MADPCTAKDCPNAARLAIRTMDHPMRSVIYFDDREAPATAQRYCKKHGADLARDLVLTVAHEDEEMKDG